MLVAVAAVAGAMYVAAASGSQQSAGPTAKQFKALKTQVAGLQKEVKSVKAEANAVATVVSCYLTTNPVGFGVLPASDLGSVSDGYLFGTDSAHAAPQPALVEVGNAPQYNIQVVDPTCVSGAFRHSAVCSAVSRLQRSGPVH